MRTLSLLLSFAAGAPLPEEDDGPGIPADVLPRVFDRFFTTRGERRGTGLGLALVKAIVDAHGWRITVDAPARFTIAFRR